MGLQQAAEFHYPCPEGHVGTVPDYYPLSPGDIAYLLHRAARLSDAVALASIQIRLSQGLVGMTCPWPSTGPLAECDTRMSHLYLTYLNAPGPEKAMVAAQIVDMISTWNRAQEHQEAPDA